MMMFAKSDPLTYLLPISFAGAFLARMYQEREQGQASRAHVAGSGTNTFASSKKLGPPTSLSKTSRVALSDGCPTCEGTCTCGDTEPVPSRYLPSMSERPTFVKESSYLLPTPTASSYGTNKGGAAGRTGKERASLQTLARRGLLPTPTVCGNYNRKGASPTSGDGLATVVGGKLSPRFVEWMMGLPDMWTARKG